MLAHVPVVSQHTHWHMGGYFGQFPQDVVKSPAVDKIATKHSWVAEDTISVTANLIVGFGDVV